MQCNQMIIFSSTVVVISRIRLTRVQVTVALLRAIEALTRDST